MHKVAPFHKLILKPAEYRRCVCMHFR